LLQLCININNNKKMEATNKIALITGGSRGLGKNAALKLAHKGNDVIITYRSKKEEADDVVNEIESLGLRAAALQLDTGKAATFAAFKDELTGTLQQKWSRDTFDFLINNAGIDAASPFAQTTEEDFDSLFNIHFKGVYFLTQTLLTTIADGGRIINLSTGLTRFATPGYAAYASMKGAIEVFTKYLAKELGSRGIAANLVAPGIIETDFTKRAFESHPGMHDFISSITALGRPGQPDDIGGVIAFLCSEDARWINAQRIEASGGMFL
jgi:NAD(P)-dependent dehydrogenase (short-subunit alcohol dehydrogenase family)